MPLSDNTDFDDIRWDINQWLARHYPYIACPGNKPLSPEQLSIYYAHCEIALIEMNMHDQYPTYVRSLRRLKNYTRRLDALKLKKETFRSRVSFK